ncbi:MAG: AAA family ATPase, partial [Gemmatimonadaceae bacterium]|nr:AAA family ATPase [Gemmatimonadaceae bacterium]
RANPGDRHLSGGFAAAVAAHLAEFPGAAAVSTGSAGVLVSLAPTLASLYPSAAPDASDGEDAVRRRALALADLLHAVSDEHPVAVLLDDLHWADEHSVRVIAAALSRLEHARLLVVLTRRPVADPQALLGAFEQLALPPLDLAAVNAFVTQVAELPATAWADVLPQQLLLATGGSPLLLVETLHDALEQGWLSVSDAGVWECDDPLRVTNSLREGSALEQRTMRLPACAQHTLLVLALVGRPIETEDASAMAGGDAVDVREHLETLERSGFVIRHGSQLLVAHDEIADAVIAASPVALREQTHAAIARAFLQRSQDETALRRAAEHATLSRDAELLRNAWRRFLASRRRQGDRRSTRRVAADFLRAASEQQAVVDLVAATPWLRRQRVRWVTAAVAVLAVAGTALSVAARRPKKLTHDFAVWVTDSVKGTRQLVGVRIDPDAPWRAGEPLVATVLDSTDFPRYPNGVVSALRRLPGGLGWRAHAVLRDGGDEVLRVDSLGNVTRLLSGPGDDAVSAASPDGRFLVGITSRYDTLTDHGQLVIVDVASGTVRRLTNSIESDYNPEWRPDGTQIAFLRRFFSRTSDDAVCVVDFDGADEQCTVATLTLTGGVFGWIDNRTLLAAHGDGSLARLDVVTGKTERIPDLLGQIISLDGDLRLCLCRTPGGDESSLYVFPAKDPSAARPLLFENRPLRGAQAYIGSLFTERSWLDTLRLVRPTGALSVEHTHQLRAEGRRSDGAPAQLHNLRWTSRSPMVATVDSFGVLRPRRIGKVWVVVSAGGWRTDSALIEISTATSHVVVREGWDSNWLKRWTPFGDPRPKIMQTARGPSLLPNGDGSYQSGVYSSVVIPSASGAGLEAWLSMPVTRLQWQSLSLALGRAPTLATLRRWDHTSGDGVPAFFAVCTFSFPGDEGGRARNLAGLGSRQTNLAISVDTSLYNGDWHRIRLQLLPDGRCAGAIDGRPLAVTQGNDPPPADGVFLHLVGHSAFNGRLVIGPLEAWSGVRGGVDWTKLDTEAAQKPRR